MKFNLLTLSVSSVLALSLVACGGGSSNNDGNSGETGNGNTPTNPSDGGGNANAFTEHATWKVNASPNNIGEICYDFDAKAEVECKGTKWDIKFENQPRSKRLWTNSGVSGDGDGGALASRTSLWNKIKAIPDASGMPRRYVTADGTAGVFNNNKWYQYNLEGKHYVYPNYNVYLVSTDNSGTVSSYSSPQIPVYALQITNYYDIGSGDRGNVTVRWIDTAMPNDVKSKSYNAMKDWVYVNLKTGDTTDVGGDWQIAFYATGVKLNGADAGNGSVGGYLAKQPAGFYDAQGKPVKDKFIAKNNSETTLSDLTNVSAYNLPAGGAPWVVDQIGSKLQIPQTGTYPNIDFGWYTYDGTTHQLLAKPEDQAQGAVIRSGEGNSYAKMWLKEINNNTGEWTFEMDVQPASKSAP